MVKANLNIDQLLASKNVKKKGGPNKHKQNILPAEAPSVAAGVIELAIAKIVEKEVEELLEKAQAQGVDANYNEMPPPIDIGEDEDVKIIKIHMKYEGMGM